MNSVAKEAILFDKDGTLIEYNHLWTDAIYAMVPVLEKEFKLGPEFVAENFYQSLGMSADGVADASPLGTGTTKQIAKVLSRFIPGTEVELLTFVQNYFHQYTINHQTELIPIGDLAKLLANLTEAGYLLGIVTSDDYDSTVFTLELLGLDHYFEFIATGDRFAPKPEREALEKFSAATGIAAEDILFVGDSSVDIQFSRHCALGVGVTSGVASQAELAQVTDFIYPSVHDVPFRELFSLIKNK